MPGPPPGHDPKPGRRAADAPHSGGVRGFFYDRASASGLAPHHDQPTGGHQERRLPRCCRKPVYAVSGRYRGAVDNPIATLSWTAIPSRSGPPNMATKHADHIYAEIAAA